MARDDAMDGPQEPFEVTLAGVRFLFKDLAGNPVRCFVSCEALMDRGAREDEQDIDEGSTSQTAKLGELFLRYRFEIEHIAMAKHESGLRSARGHDVEVTTSDLNA